MKKAFIQLHIAVLLAGSTAILGKFIELNEGLLTFYRMFLCAIMLGAILVYRKKFQKLSEKKTLQLFGVGPLFLCIGLVFMEASNIPISRSLLLIL